MLIVFRKLWYELTNPRVEETGWTMQEYLTRVIYTMVSLGILVMTVVVPLVDYSVGKPQNAPTIIVVVMDFLVLTGWVLIKKGHWRISGIFLPFVFLVPAGYMIFTVGPATTAVLQLAIAVLLPSGCLLKIIENGPLYGRWFFISLFSFLALRQSKVEC